MRYKAAALLVVLAATFSSGLVGFAIGGLKGFYDGYVVATYIGDVTSADIALRALRAHHRGETEAGREMLELMIDAALISDWAHHDLVESRPFYAPSGPYEVNLPKALHRLAEHRRSHPSEMPEPGASVVQSTLARLGGQSGQR